MYEMKMETQNDLLKAMTFCCEKIKISLKNVI